MPEISLSNGGVALVDESDAALVSGYFWMRSPLGYAVGYPVGRSTEKKVFMHRLLLCAERGKVVDHINHNTLDNRRLNLRICSHAENMKNRRIHKNNQVGLKGVCVEKGRYRARIVVDGKKISLGCYDSADVAYAAYVHAAKIYHGEFAHA